MSWKKIAAMASVVTLLGWGCGPDSAAHASEPKVVADSASPVRSDTVVALDTVPHADAEIAEEIDPESAWDGQFTGKMNDRIEFSLDLHAYHGDVRGTMIYKTSGKPIVVLGTLHEDGTLFLHEFDRGGNITGVLSATTRGARTRGTWYDSADETQMPMELVASTSDVKGAQAEWPFKAKSVAGVYTFHYDQEGPSGSLIVRQVGDRVRCTFECFTSAFKRNAAQLHDIEAPLVDDVAHFKLPGKECEFEIRFHEGFAMVAYLHEKYDCGFGESATIEGEYLQLK